MAHSQENAVIITELSLTKQKKKVASRSEKKKKINIIIKKINLQDKRKHTQKNER